MKRDFVGVRRLSKAGSECVFREVSMMVNIYQPRALCDVLRPTVREPIIAML